MRLRICICDHPQPDRKHLVRENRIVVCISNAHLTQYGGIDGIDRALPCQLLLQCYRFKTKQLVIVGNYKFTADKGLPRRALQIECQLIVLLTGVSVRVAIEVKRLCFHRLNHCNRTACAADSGLCQIPVIGSANGNGNGICAGFTGIVCAKAYGHQLACSADAVQCHGRQLDRSCFRGIYRSLGAGKHPACVCTADGKNCRVIVHIHIQRRNILKILCRQGHIGGIARRYRHCIG